MACEVVAAPSPSPVSALAGQWWVIQTRSRFEQRLSSELSAAGIAHYLPLSREFRRKPDGRGGIRRFKAMVPAFPCYVFVNGDETDRYFAARSIATCRVIEVANQARLARDLAGIEAVLGVDPELKAVAALRAGKRVEVVEGPLRGQTGLVERIGGTRVYFTVEMFGQAIPADLPAHQLQPLD